MQLASFILFFIVALCFHSTVVVQANNWKNSKLSEIANKYASPQLYVFGGYDDTKSGSDQYLSSASQLNSSIGTWERTTGMSTPRFEFCGAVVGTKIYLFGGRDGYKNLETAEIYDCEKGIYSPFRSMTGPREDCGAAVLGDFIYVAGGYDASKMSSVFRYNIKTTRRENVSSMHTARIGLQLVELSGRLYAINGGTNTVETYNSTTDRWSTAASTQFVHTYFGAAVHDGKIYVCSNNGFEAYSPDSDQWETLAPVSTKDGQKLVSMNGKLWALGGRDSKSVHSYNTSTNKWTQHTDMDVARGFHTAFVVNH